MGESPHWMEGAQWSWKERRLVMEKQVQFLNILGLSIGRMSVGTVLMLLGSLRANRHKLKSWT
jgi:hypothetical protein